MTLAELANAARHAYAMGIPTADGFQNISLAVARAVIEQCAKESESFPWKQVRVPYRAPDAIAIRIRSLLASLESEAK